jgi:hypothetical protein
VKLKREVERPGFAAVAWYRKPVGQGVEGLSIRFAEEAIRCMTNLLPESPIVYDSRDRRMLRVMLTDLESNITWSRDMIIDKTVERSYLKKGQTALQVRTNSKGEATYLVEATEDELGAKEGRSSRRRSGRSPSASCPGDLQDEAKKRILEIRSGDVRRTRAPRGRRSSTRSPLLNVLPSELKRYLGHDIGTAEPGRDRRPPRRVRGDPLRRDDWAEALAEKLDEEPAAAPEPEKKAGLDGVSDELEKKRAAVTPTGPTCPDHATQTIVNGDGSRACFADGCKWTAPAPAERAGGEADVETPPSPVAVQALAARRATRRRRGRSQGRLEG